jgi:hypothetical protein
VTLTLDGDCCSGDLCNRRPLVHTPPTTTHAPTQATHHQNTTPQSEKNGKTLLFKNGNATIIATICNLLQVYLVAKN